MSNRARICVPICVSEASELVPAIEQASEIADMIELRFDCLHGTQLRAALEKYSGLRNPTSTPFVVTFRPAHEGGNRALTLAERVEFWLNLKGQMITDYADIEADLVLDSPPELAYSRSQLSGGRLICSRHDFAGVPSDLQEIYARMAGTDATILKIAVHADDAVDCLPIFSMLEHAQKESREVIAIAMGQAGVLTRILGPSRGSFLTYGSLSDERTTAPGQVSARNLREVYRIDQIDRRTEITGLIGSPVAHSISPHIQNAASSSAGMNAVFIPFEVRDLAAFIRRMVRASSREIDWNLRGFSVTAPHKEAILKHLDWIEPAAKDIGAVNTIVIEDGALNGYNTDAAAFIEPLKPHCNSTHGLRAAVIGAGGAARGVIWALLRGSASVALFARDPEKGRRLSEQFHVDWHRLAEADFAAYDLVVNATPLGTLGEYEEETPVKAPQLRGVRLAYDLVYNPTETRFMREAKTAGCQTIGGLEMLIAQAVEQFKLWTGMDPDLAAMRTAAERALNR